MEPHGGICLKKNHIKVVSKQHKDFSVVTTVTLVTEIQTVENQRVLEIRFVTFSFKSSSNVTKSLVSSVNWHQCNPVAVSYGKLFCVGIPIGKSRRAFPFDRRKRRFFRPDKEMLAIDERYDETEVCRDRHVLTRREGKRSRFEDRIIIQLRIRFAESRFLIERQERKPGEDPHRHIRQCLHCDVRCKVLGIHISDAFNPRQSIHVQLEINNVILQAFFSYEMELSLVWAILSDFLFSLRTAFLRRR